MKIDHEQLLQLIPPKGTPQTAENLPNVSQVEKMEYPADWGAVELEQTVPAAKDQWHDTIQMMSEDDDV